MNAFLAFLQQAAGILRDVGAWLAGQARQAWDVLSAITGDHPESARRVAVYTLAMLAAVFLVPKALKKFSK